MKSQSFDLKITREGKKRFVFEKPRLDQEAGYSYSGNGSYLGLTMAETLEDMFKYILRSFDLDKELEVRVRGRVGPETFDQFSARPMTTKIETKETL